MQGKKNVFTNEQLNAIKAMIAQALEEWHAPGAEMKRNYDKIMEMETRIRQNRNK